MFVVSRLKVGICLNCEKDQIECLDVVCERGTLKGLLCVKCFVRQIKMRMQCQPEAPHDRQSSSPSQ